MTKAQESTNNTFLAGILEPEMQVDIGNKRYLIKRHFIGRRSVTEAINKVIINEAVRKTA